MTDDIDRLKAAMDAATPEPDPARKGATLRLAEENFARHQGSRAPVRPMSRRGPIARLGQGFGQMLTTLTSRAGLTATTAIVAVGLLMVLPEGRDLLTPKRPAPADVQTESGRARMPEAPVGADTGAAGVASEADSVRVDRLVQESEALADAAPEPVPAPPPMRGLPNAGGAPMPAQAIATPEGAYAGGLAATGSRMAPQAAVSAENMTRRVFVKEPPAVAPEADTEQFANAETSPLKVTTEEPVSTFSIDVDTASYAVVRSSLMAGMLPPEDAVRVEEMVNYFPYAYPAPEGDAPFRPTISVVPTPWNAGTELVHIGIQGSLPPVAERPPLNLVFLIDTSGSMQDANKLPLLKQSFRLMLSELRPDDEVAIVTYAGSAGEVLEPTRAAERSTILAALDRLEAGGSTAGEEGLQQAYRVAEGMTAEGEVSRVILATDGDFNVGISHPAQLKDFIAKKRESGTYLSVLGFGRGNLDDATMQALAQNGNGQAAYIDTLSEAQKVLVDQLTGALFPIANDVKIQIEFNPAEVAEYRLIGYETRALRREDFDNDRIDAGDIGAGHTVTALYEITPVGSDAIRNGPLRYAESPEAATAPASASDELGFFRLRYKLPGEDESRLIEEPIIKGQGTESDDVRFATAIAGFGQLLRGSTYLGNWGWDEAIALASESRGEDPFGYRSEAVTLMRLAEALSGR